MWQQLLKDIQAGDTKAIARSISLIENEKGGSTDLLSSLPPAGHARVIGITGPPGAGKSTLVDALIGSLVQQQARVAVLCIDPSSPFNLGAVLGDRIRMSQWYTHPAVFIRSLASRGAMGGLHPRIIEITDLLRAAPFDYIIVETVGVGQSEIEITGLADVTVVVLVPEGGDEIQTMKAGLMEIADIFAVNKSDRPGAEAFVKNLRLMLAPAFSHKKTTIPIIKTVAQEKKGIDELLQAITGYLASGSYPEKKTWLLTEKALKLIQAARMKDIDQEKIRASIQAGLADSRFNLYQFVKQYYPPS